MCGDILKFKLVEEFKSAIGTLNEDKLNEARLNSALDSITKQIKDFLNKNGVQNAEHPIEVFPSYDLGLVKVVFKGTGVSYTVVPGKLDDKSVTKSRPVKLLPTYGGATYRNGAFYDSSGKLIGDAYVSVLHNGSQSDYSTELDDLTIKSSDTMTDFISFVKHLSKDSVVGNRIQHRK